MRPSDTQSGQTGWRGSHCDAGPKTLGPDRTDPPPGEAVDGVTLTRSRRPSQRVEGDEMSVGTRHALALVVDTIKESIARSDSRKRAAALALASLWTLVMIAAQAGAGNAPHPELVASRSSVRLEAVDIPAADRARGRIFTGLMPTTRCPHAWSVISGLCTHGPDPAPAGVDVTRHRGTAELVASTDEGTSSASSSTGSVPCYGDGTTGNRVQVVYAHAADVPDRFSDLASSLVAWAANVDNVFYDSAQETGGIRHVRWVTDSSCNLVIQRVQLSTTGDDSYSNTVSELESVGLQKSDRKYLVWVDANLYCGIASLYDDDSAALSNVNNVGPGYARIDSACWGFTSEPVEAHELMHMLGGVQYTAPHSSGGGHCTDEYDRMCYQDSSSVTLTYPCSSPSHDHIFDCNHDDYFSTNPPSGSYLATHWNTASSSFLEAVAPDGWSPSTTTAPTSSPSPSPLTSPTAPTTSPSPSPSPSTSPTAPTPSPSPSTSPTVSSTSTVTFSGALNRKAPSRTYSLTVGTGELSASLRFSKAPKLTLALYGSSGSIVSSQSGPSPETFISSVATGTYSLVVSGTGNASFTLSVTFTNP